MPFTVQDFHDLIRLLEQHPEWRAELRRHVLTEELPSLPALVRELADAQGRAEARLERLEAAVSALTEAPRHTDERLAELAEAQRRTDERLAELAEAQLRTNERLAELAETQRRTDELLAAPVEAQQRILEQVAALAAAQLQTTERVDRLERAVTALA